MATGRVEALARFLCKKSGFPEEVTRVPEGKHAFIEYAGWHSFEEYAKEVLEFLECQAEETLPLQ